MLLLCFISGNKCSHKCVATTKQCTYLTNKLNMTASEKSWYWQKHKTAQRVLLNSMITESMILLNWMFLIRNCDQSLLLANSCTQLYKTQNLHCINFKRQLKVTPTCFESFAKPSSGSAECAWLKLLVIFFVCLVGVWRHNFEPAVCVHVPCTHTAGSKLCRQTPTKHMKNITSIFSQARSALRVDGSQMIRNMSGWPLIVF